MNNSILDKLEKFIEFDNKNKSSHWRKKLTPDADYKNPFTPLGFGKYTKKTLFKSFLQCIFSIVIFGNNIFKSETYKNYKIVFDKSNRQIDVGTIRHVLTFELLKNITLPSNVCVIGDGKCNFVIVSHLNRKP